VAAGIFETCLEQQKRNPKWQSLSLNIPDPPMLNQEEREETRIIKRTKVIAQGKRIFGG